MSWSPVYQSGRLAGPMLAIALFLSSASIPSAQAQGVLTIQPTGTTTDRYALLVGISDYPGDAEDLDGGPLNDVALMTDLLVSRLGFPRSNILILTDEQASWANIVTAFGSHLRQATKDGVALFYYSGHGARLSNVGPDVEDDDSDEVLVTYGSTPGLVTPMRDDELGWLVGGLNSDRVLVVLDNCYSGTGTRGGRGAVRWGDIARGVPLPTGLHSSDSKVSRAIGKRFTKAALMRTGIEPPSRIEARTSVDGPSGHVLLAASAEHETSLNVSLTLENGSRVAVGLFTAALYRELVQANLATTSFAELTTSLRATARLVTAQLREAPQTPQAEGTRRDAFIGSFLGLP